MKILHAYDDHGANEARQALHRMEVERTVTTKPTWLDYAKLNAGPLLWSAVFFALSVAAAWVVFVCIAAPHPDWAVAALAMVNAASVFGCVFASGSCLTMLRRPPAKTRYQNPDVYSVQGLQWFDHETREAIPEPFNAELAAAWISDEVQEMLTPEPEPTGTATKSPAYQHAYWETLEAFMRDLRGFKA